ncbi:prepilin peptidase [Leucobacter soli]|uniref:Type 4 prepilin-like proteins leader peptide-processing enzyme n=1 Tax=Leucobacter soli TaxID=2812850 RepID=A0A916JTI6_9MICO|nr:A24 family peptidase [Leucobacter soli]CAG7601109.1 Type 4 prepilin-like proteins leader peptide-processing enzyme [Leucobacter soli]
MSGIGAVSAIGAARPGAAHLETDVLGIPGAEILPWFVLAAGILGLILGSFLNVVILRVPRGESLFPGSRCPKCGRLIRAWQNVPVISWIVLGGRCARCRERISLRYPLIELATGAIFAGVAWWLVSAFGWPGDETLPAIAWWLTVIAYFWFAAAGIALTVIDVEHHRLPDSIVGPAFIVVGVALAAAALLSADGPEWPRLIWAAVGAAGLFLLYLIIVMVTPNGMGGGDLKLAPVTGIVMGFIGWGALAVGAFAGFALGAVFGICLIIMGRAKRRSPIPFGPFMLLGAWIGIIWGERIMQAYLVLFGIA